jgi:hypothetical protein
MRCRLSPAADMAPLGPGPRWAKCGHRAPLSEARETDVTFNHELPTGGAELLSINGSGGPTAGEHFQTLTTIFAGGIDSHSASAVSPLVIGSKS